MLKNVRAYLTSLLGKLPPANLNPNHVQFEKISLDIALNS